MIGTETPSCQSVNGNPKYNKCLLGYILNPCTQAILIKSKEDESIVARSIIRILWNEKQKQPVLLLEKNYISSGREPVDYEKRILKYATDIAKEMKLELISTQFSNSKMGNCLDNIYSYDSGKAPFDYSDSAGGITDGKFIIIPSTNLLYSPKLEPKLDTSKSTTNDKNNPQRRGLQMDIA
jgi:hypothetical protein